MISSVCLMSPSSMPLSPHFPHTQATMEGSEALLTLPGALMVGREPLDLGAWPDVGSLRSTRAVLGAAYSIVQV